MTTKLPEPVAMVRFGLFEGSGGPLQQPKKDRRKTMSSDYILTVMLPSLYGYAHAAYESIKYRGEPDAKFDYHALAVVMSRMIKPF